MSDTPPSDEQVKPSEAALEQALAENQSAPDVPVETPKQTGAPEAGNEFGRHDSQAGGTPSDTPAGDAPASDAPAEGGQVSQ